MNLSTIINIDTFSPLFAAFPAILGLPCFGFPTKRNNCEKFRLLDFRRKYSVSGFFVAGEALLNYDKLTSTIKKFF